MAGLLFRQICRYKWVRQTLIAVAVGLLAAGCSASYSRQCFRVLRVNDGDTITLVDGRLVRYLGINAPEIDHRAHKAEPFGFAARRYNQMLLKGKTVCLEFDRQRRGRYGRLLAYVFLRDGRFVNRLMLEKGYAYFLPSQADRRYQKLLLAAQQTAMSSASGLWHDWHEKAGQYIGNRRSKRLHLKSCPLAARISRKNRVGFTSRWQAYWQGYAPARQCMHDRLRD